MKYPSYLIHFNPNHDPKNGQFAPATGSFKGIRVSNPNKRAVKEGMYTKEGYVTRKAEKSFDKLSEYQRLRKASDEAGEKLIKSDKRLMEGFGGSYKNVDDPSFLWMVADSYGVKGAKEFLDTINKEIVYLRDNKEDIKRGRAWANTYLHNKIPDIRMDFY